MSKKAKYTAGPWQVHRNHLGDPIVYGGSGLIASTSQSDKYGDEEKLANATLMSAAPELLAACKLAQLWLANCVPMDSIPGPKPLPVIAAAIAKAEGI